MANEVPSLIAAPEANWQQMAGVGGQNIPATPDPTATTGIGALAAQLNVIPTAPTAPQYVSSTAGLQPRIHVPTMGPTDQSTQNRPLSNQATSLKQARRQNRFAGITNAINSVTNEVQKRKYESITTDVTNISRAQTQIANAQQAAQSAVATLKDKNASAEAKKTAQAVLTSSQQVIDSNQKSVNAILQDDKRRKELSKAFDISFTDPSKNQDPAVKAGRAGLDAAKKNDAAGLSANTPEEKAVQDYLNKQKEQSGSYATQFMSQMPQQLTANPQYEAQLKQYTDQQKYATQYIIPKIIDQQTKNMTTQMLTDAKMQDRLMQSREKIVEQMMKDKSSEQRSRIMADAHLRGIYAQNAERAQAAQLRATTALQMAGMKDAKGTWKQQAFENQALMTFTNEIDKTVTANKSQQEQIDGIVTSAKLHNNGVLSPEQEKVVNNLKDNIKAGQDFISQMTDNRQKVTTKMYGTPVFPSTATPKGTQNGQPQSSTYGGTFPNWQSGDTKPIAPNGPADDSAAAREAAAIDAKDDNWLEKANAYLDTEDTNDENLNPY